MHSRVSKLVTILVRFHPGHEPELDELEEVWLCDPFQRTSYTLASWNRRVTDLILQSKGDSSISV